MNLKIYVGMSFPSTHTCATIFSHPHMTFGLTSQSDLWSSTDTLEHDKTPKQVYAHFKSKVR